MNYSRKWRQDIHAARIADAVVPVAGQTEIIFTVKKRFSGSY